MYKTLRYYFYAAAGTTGIAGILHLRLFFGGLDRDINDIGIFFLISGVLQLFWVIPMIGRWGRPWYYVGMGGTIVLIIIWLETQIAQIIIELASAACPNYNRTRILKNLDYYCFLNKKRNHFQPPPSKYIVLV